MNFDAIFVKQLLSRITFQQGAIKSVGLRNQYHFKKIQFFHHAYQANPSYHGFFAREEVT